MRIKKALLGAPALLFLSAVLLLPLAGCGGSPAADFNVVHYYLPECSSCAQMKESVRGLEGEFPGRLKTVSYDATEPDAARMVRNLEFRDHGLVVRGRRGEVLYKLGDHNGGIEEIRQAVRGLVAQQSASL